MLLKIDDNIIDLKEMIQTNNTNGTIKSNSDELIHNLYNHIGKFSSKMSESSLRGDLNTNKRNCSLYYTCGCSSNKIQKVRALISRTML